MSGQWPREPENPGNNVALRRHVDGCPSSRDLVTVATGTPGRTRTGFPRRAPADVRPGLVARLDADAPKPRRRPHGRFWCFRGGGACRGPERGARHPGVAVDSARRSPGSPTSRRGGAASWRRSSVGGGGAAGLALRCRCRHRRRRPYSDAPVPLSRVIGRLIRGHGKTHNSWGRGLEYWCLPDGH